MDFTGVTAVILGGKNVKTIKNSAGIILWRVPEPPIKNVYSFTVLAQNDYGSDTKRVTLTVQEVTE